MLRCHEVTRLHASDEIHSAGLMTRFGVRIHLMMCRHCSRYIRELARIGEAARALCRESDDSAARVDAMVQHVLRESGRPPV